MNTNSEPKYEIGDLLTYTYVPMEEDTATVREVYTALSGKSVVVIDVDTEADDGITRYSVALTNEDEDDDFFTAFEQELA